MLRHYHRFSKDIDIFVPDPHTMFEQLEVNASPPFYGAE
jgi:hypothetical protein